MTNRLIELPGRRQSVAEIVVSLGVVRIEPQSLPELSHGAIEVALRSECDAKVTMSLHVIIVGCDRLLEMPGRLGMAALRKKSNRQIIVRGGVVRLMTERVAVVSYGFVGLSEGLRRDTQVVVSVGIVGPDRQSIAKMGKRFGRVSVVRSSLHRGKLGGGGISGCQNVSGWDHGSTETSSCGGLTSSKCG